MVMSFLGLHRALAPVSVFALCLLAAACSQPPRWLASADPSNPSVHVPATAYRPVLSGFVSQRPAEPGSWREQNERVAPRQKQ